MQFVKNNEVLEFIWMNVKYIVCFAFVFLLRYIHGERADERRQKTGIQK